ncbi:hypothetical protein L6164_024864 [Bauhinia variegata]|uniref:Uncharacterized protein n=1 Tax=Bauhinia variegata TaxID=167791 RepID=A0ACB9M1U5_BAUVA|nr:hypothetical protein L6164_024864 [Bauhinia variegata]
MKQSIGNGDAMLTADESEVVEILVQLSNLILESETRRRFSFAWGSKKRRSAIDIGSVTAPSHLRLRLSASPTPAPAPAPSPLHQAANAVGGVVGPSCDAQAPPLVKVEATSPATPLSFSPSESDEKPNLLKRRTPLNKKREEYLKTIHELTERRDLLQGEVENVKRYYGELKALNLKLKARQKELNAGVKRENPNLEISLSLAHQNSVNLSSSHDHRQLQLQLPSSQHFLSPILNQASGLSQTQTSGSVQNGYNLPTTSLPSSNSNMVGSIGIPDLNVSLEESFAVDSCQPFDPSMANKNLSRARAMAAQARQKRIQIYRVKNPIGISKPRYSNR